MHHSITSPLPFSNLCTLSQALCSPRFELFERLERFEFLILWLPAAAQGAVELHHGVELGAARARQE
jgi:hypothetical protein